MTSSIHHDFATTNHENKQGKVRKNTFCVDSTYCVMFAKKAMLKTRESYWGCGIAVSDGENPSDLVRT